MMYIRITLLAAVVAVSLPSLALAQDIKFSSATAPHSGGTANAGAKFTARYVLQNGSASVAAGSFHVHYYYCQTKAKPLTGCTYMTYDYLSGGIAAGGSRTVTSRTLTTPGSVVYGAGYLRIVADSNGAVAESDETNNVSDVAISVTKRPDLRIGYTSFPNAGSVATVGAVFWGRLRIDNASYTSMSTSAFTVTYAYCPGKSSTGCVQLGSSAVTANLYSGSGSGYFNTPALTIPSAAQNGTRYIRVVADKNDTVTESNEANNVVYHSITISQVQTNLKITSITAPYTGTAARAGDKLTVSTTLKNDSIYGLSTGFRVSYYYCPTQSTTGCTYMAYINVGATFTGGQSRTYTSGLLTLPGSVLYGTGYIRAQVDSTSVIPEGTAGEADNNAYAKISITARPDLTASAYFPQTGNTTSGGSQFTGRVQVFNAKQTSRTTAGFTLAYYLCPHHTTATASCKKLGQQSHSGLINAWGKTAYIYTPTLTLPATVQNGKLYVRVLLDTKNTVTEGNETNNTYNASINVTHVKSDLQFVSVKVPGTGVVGYASAKFTVHTVAKNASVNGFTTDFRVRYYYCATKATTLANCTYLGNTTVTTDFAANQTVSIKSGTIYMPGSVMYGAGVIRTLLDSDHWVVETDETNNTHDAAITVTARPDVYIYKWAYPKIPSSGSTKGPGSKFTVKYRIDNAGYTSRMNTPIEIQFAYCPTAAATGCVALGKHTVSKTIDAGKHSGDVFSPWLVLPKTVLIGTRYIRIHLDAKDALKENVETNNIYYASFKVTEQQVDLSLPAVSAPATGSTKAAGSTFTVKSSVRCTGAPLATGFGLRYEYCPAKAAAGCTLLGNKQVTHSFTAGETKELASPILKLPKTAMYGPGFVRFVVDAAKTVDERDETNNEAYAAVNVSTAPDLAVTGAKVPSSGSTAGPGSAFKATYSVTNASGTSAFSADHTASYFWCKGKTTSGCVVLGTQKVTVDMDSGDTAQITTPALKIPAGTISGTHYLRVWLDSGNAVVESDENNNNRYDVVMVGGAPDLSVSALYATTTGAGTSSAGVDYSVVICNPGDATSDTFELGLYYNLAKEPACGAKADHKWSISGLAKGACLIRTHKRAPVKPGVYLDWALVDAACKVTESSETNNGRKVAYTITGAPDMGVDAGPDAGMDAGMDMGMDAGVDMGMDAGVDSSLDSAAPDAGLDQGGDDATAKDAAGEGEAPDQKAGADSKATPDADACVGQKPCDQTPCQEGCSVAGSRGGTTAGLLLLLLGLLAGARRRHLHGVAGAGAGKRTSFESRRSR